MLSVIMLSVVMLRFVALLKNSYGMDKLKQMGHYSAAMLTNKMDRFILDAEIFI
jgi:hypothetical protein